MQFWINFENRTTATHYSLISCRYLSLKLEANIRHSAIRASKFGSRSLLLRRPDRFLVACGIAVLAE